MKVSRVLQISSIFHGPKNCVGTISELTLFPSFLPNFQMGFSSSFNRLVPNMAGTYIYPIKPMQIIPQTTSLIGFHLGFSRVLHGSVKMTMKTDRRLQNTPPEIKSEKPICNNNEIKKTGSSVSDQISNDVDKICKLVYNQNRSSISSSLDGAITRISPALVEEVLRKLSNAGFLALGFFKWAEKQEGFLYNTEIFHALIDALGKIKQFKLTWDLVKNMRNRGLLKKETFLLIVRRYARARKIGEAVEAFERMQKFGLKPDLSDYNRLLDTICKSRHVQKAQAIFDDMKRKRFSPDLKTYSILMEGWGDYQNLPKMLEVYQEMGDHGFKPDVVTYGILINAFCKARKLDKAIQQFEEMKVNNCFPSPHIYCTLINGFGSEKRLHEALEFFDESKACGFVPELPTYNAVIGAYCWAMRFEDAYKVLDVMEKSGISLNSRSYNIILHHLIKSGKTKGAYLIFEKMETLGCKPDIDTYAMMVTMFCQQERVDMALNVWEKMKRKGILPGMHLFSALINGFCDENRLDDACKYFLEMLDKGIRPPVHMFGKLKQSLTEAGKEDLALNLAQKLDILRKSSISL